MSLTRSLCSSSSKNARMCCTRHCARHYHVARVTARARRHITRFPRYVRRQCRLDAKQRRQDTADVDYAALHDIDRFRSRRRCAWRLGERRSSGSPARAAAPAGGRGRQGRRGGGGQRRRGAEQLRQEAAAVLDVAPRVVGDVHKHDPEALGHAHLPLKVVQQRPARTRRARCRLKGGVRTTLQC